MDRNRGFTILEFSISLTVIAILAAISFSRLLDFETHAKSVKAQNIYGAMRTAATLAQAVCMIDLSVGRSPTCTKTGGKVNMSGVSVAMVNQFPAATQDGIMQAISSMPDGVTVSGTNPILLDIAGAKPPHCRISYAEAPTPGSYPKITVDTSEC